MQRSVNRRPAGQGDWGGRQAVASIGIVDVTLVLQVRPAQVAVKCAAQSIYHCRIRLQAHALLQAAHEYAGNLLPLLGQAGFPLYDGGHYQRFVRGFIRQIRGPVLPLLVQHLEHADMGASQQLKIGGIAGKMIGVGKEQTLRTRVGFHQLVQPAVLRACQHRHQGGLLRQHRQRL